MAVGALALSAACGGGGATDQVDATDEVGVDASPTAFGVDAGADQTISEPLDAVTLTAVVQNGDAGTTVAWRQIDGAPATLSDATTLRLTVSGLALGAYTFEITATSGAGDVATDQVQVMVTADLTRCDGGSVYVATTGTDAPGGGSQAAPWATLGFAATQAITPGTTIRVAAGDYLEPATVHLAPGVCLEGAGPATVIRSSLTAPFVPIIALHSDAEGTLGNQHVSDLTLDGSNLATSWGISVAARSNVSLHGLVIRDFFETGATFAGITNPTGPTAPTVYAIGNSFWGNTVSNSSTNDTVYGRGNVQFGGQDGMRVFDNVITQPQRTAGATGDIGWPLKMANEGHIKNCKVYRNQLLRTPFIGVNGQNNNWNFAFEMWNVEGLEVYDNTFEGALDIAWASKGDAAYGLYVHDNVFRRAELNSAIEDGLRLETSERDVIIEDNQFLNLAQGVVFSPHDYQGNGEGVDIHRVTIQRNRFEHMGVAGDVAHSAIRFENAEADPVVSVQDVRILHNTFIGATDGASIYMGVAGPSYSGTVERVDFINNVFVNFSYAAMQFGAGFQGAPTTLAGVVIRNNAIFGSGSDNAPLFVDASAPDLVLDGNLTVDPQLGADLAPLPGSPLIDAGVDLGQPYAGAGPDIGAVETE